MILRFLKGSTARDPELQISEPSTVMYAVEGVVGSRVTLKEFSHLIGIIWGLYWGYIVIMGKIMETTIVYWGYIEIMEKKMETTIVLQIYFFLPG